MTPTNETKKPRFLKRGDLWLVSALLLLAAALFVFHFATPNTDGTAAKITVDNKTVATLSLSHDTTYTVETASGYNVVVVEDGRAFVREADCKNHICVKSRAVSRVGETIVCLPHKMKVTVVGDTSSAVDFVV